MLSLKEKRVKKSSELIFVGEVCGFFKPCYSFFMISYFCYELLLNPLLSLFQFCCLYPEYGANDLIICLKVALRYHVLTDCFTFRFYQFPKLF